MTPLVIFSNQFFNWSKSANPHPLTGGGGLIVLQVSSKVYKKSQKKFLKGCYRGDNKER